MALVLSCSGASPTVGRRYALVYGITRYLGGPADPVPADSTTFPQNASPNLSYPALDAQAIADMLARKGYEVRLRVVDAAGAVHVNGAAGATADAPTRANLESVDLPYFASLMGAEDTFVFYYSGHGTQDAAQTTEYIVPYLAVKPAGSSYTLDSSGLVGQNDLAAMLRSLPSPRKIVILDSCNSGGFIGNTLEVDRVPRSYHGLTLGISPTIISKAVATYFSFSTSVPDGITPYGDAIVISAAGADEFSYEGALLPDGSPLDHGVMTYFLLQAPSHADLDGNGVITTMEIYAFTRAAIDADWNANPSVIAYGETFSPHISGGPVDWVLF
jgi:hypothetical protein